ncbi:Spc7 kinetochore protein-domain-containing protein [Lentinula raphanica]|uniref:Spc7 kinetochore protein-domain-containing protein n=1 Tax=Lentinula raphanica TaxID=153919 RepID=A0AA38PER6_9AGAR|nr:Spc7 kinetochore protein-domain-containing protein [Lentinula raphanica]KAJ3841318.1 Spc7 kinetochore protein-domain-containing protein [Lentinula raphanica]
MVVSASSRRKSIGVVQEGRVNNKPRKKRTYSSFGTSKLSPLARSRLSIGNVKGILKSRPSIASSSQSSNSPASQPSRPQSQSFAEESTGVTESMEFTQDYQVPIHDNHTRKSLGRRVSFRDKVHVRYFEGDDTGSTAASQQSPEKPDDVPASDIDAPVPVFNDENAYPGAYRRRSSVRKSLAASEDMDVTTTNVGAFLLDEGDNSALLDEDMDMDDANSDMDVTVSFGGNLRRRSSIAPSRAPLAQISSNSVEPQEESFTSEQSYTSDGDQSQPMEVTVPLSQSLRPANQDEAWLALVRATHSGNASMAASDDGEGLDDADVEAMVGRDAGRRYTVNFNDVSNDTISDVSVEQSQDMGNQTMDLSKIIGRVSFGDDLGRPSVASSMDESVVYGTIVPDAASTSRSSLAPVAFSAPEAPPLSSEPPKELSPVPSSGKEVDPPLTPLGVFSAAPPKANASAPPPPTRPPSSSSPTKFPVFTPKPQAKPPTKQFSAAFAPPVTRATPKKPTGAAGTQETSQSAAKKRERTISASSSGGVESGKPSPAKRQAMEDKWTNKVATPASLKPASTTTETPRLLSPTKRAPFQSVPVPASAAPAPSPPATGIRQPGYYARRKSLSVGLANSSSKEGGEAGPSMPSSSTKTASMGNRRASVSSGPSDAWTRFDKGAVAVADRKGKGKAKAVEEEEIVVTEEQTPTAEEPEMMMTTEQEEFPPTESDMMMTSEDPVQNLPPETMNVVQSSAAPKTTVIDLSTILEVTDIDDEEYTVASNNGPSGMDVAATEKWRDGVPEDGYEVDEVPMISIEQFLEMTGIKFMELSAPRRSTYASQIPSRQPRNPSEIPLAEYAVAMAIDVPQLSLYSRVARDLQEWIDQSKIGFAQAEEEASKVTPLLFAEYLRADQEGQSDLARQLKLIKTNVRLQAKSDWYGWKLQWLDSLKYGVQKALTNLENDAKALEKLKMKTDEIVPDLEKEYEELVRELEAEQKEVAEIEQCDQDYLNELKTSIAEQNVEVESLRAEVKEANDQLRWLEERLESVALQKQEATSAIAEADRLLHIQTNSTRVEVIRLRNELQALEDLHMFHISNVQPGIFEYTYASAYQITIPCRNYLPLVNQVGILRIPELRSRYKDEFPVMTQFLLSAAEEYIRGSKAPTIRHIIQRLADFWTSTTQIRAQIRQLSMKYPVEIETREIPGRPFSEFSARAMVLFPTKKAKAYVSFVFDTDSFSRWPASIRSLRWEVEVCYGKLDEKAILETIAQRMSQVTPTENYACLIDACIEAQEVCT